MAALFRVARNPDELSTLPYLIEVPLPSGPLRLKAKDTWPRTAKVYCHRADEWPAEAELLDEVAVRSCVRRGVAVDLVLDRGRENRSQIVFTTLKGGREGIFWQSARTMRKTRPGLRVPSRRSAAGVLDIIVDTRERYAWSFADQQATTAKRALAVGDYAVALDGEIVAVVERKSLPDLATRLVDGSLLITLGELASVPRAAIVVEDRWADVFRLQHVSPSMVAEMIAGAQVRYPTVPIIFCETRSLGVGLPVPRRRGQLRRRIGRRRQRFHLTAAHRAPGIRTAAASSARFWKFRALGQCARWPDLAESCSHGLLPRP